MSNTKILIPDDEEVINVSDFFKADEDQPDTTGLSTSASHFAYMCLLGVLVYPCLLILLTWRKYKGEIMPLLDQTPRPDGRKLFTQIIQADPTTLCDTLGGSMVDY